MSSGNLGKAVCCPWCGTPTLERDHFGMDQSAKGVAYVCVLCFKGFMLTNSPRTRFAREMFKRDRAVRPPDNEHVMKPGGGSRPLSARSLFELTRLEELLRAKRPRTKTGKDANAAQLVNVRAELARRHVKPGALTFRIGEIYPPGTI